MTFIDDLSLSLVCGFVFFMLYRTFLYNTYLSTRKKTSVAVKSYGSKRRAYYVKTSIYRLNSVPSVSILLKPCEKMLLNLSQSPLAVFNLQCPSRCWNSGMGLFSIHAIHVEILWLVQTVICFGCMAFLRHYLTHPIESLVNFILQIYKLLQSFHKEKVGMSYVI